jgi:hypothetical protein
MMTSHHRRHRRVRSLLRRPVQGSELWRRSGRRTPRYRSTPRTSALLMVLVRTSAPPQLVRMLLLLLLLARPMLVLVLVLLLL